jgi:hypothetical protein
MEAIEVTDNTPGQIIAGSTHVWTVSLPSFRPADGYALEFHLAGASYVGVDATVLDDDTFQVKIVPADTTSFPAGIYGRQYRATKGSDIYVELEGTVEVRTLLGASLDTRSQARRIVDAIDALIEGRATSDQMSYQIGNRALARIPLPDLRQMREYYARIVAAESRNGRQGWRVVKHSFKRS